MEARITCGNRETVIRILEMELGIPPEYDPMPGFACHIGEYTLLRDGRILSDGDGDALRVLGRLMLCDYPAEEPEEPENGIFYRMELFSGQTLLNLFGILSARQYLLNPAIGVKRTFYISSGLIDDLYAHPPAALSDFLVAVHGRDGEYGGVDVNRGYLTFTGFRKADQAEGHLHRQLADRIVASARSSGWIKPHTKNIRNKKYAMRTWMNSIGMTGVEYEEIRQTFLSRLPGKSDRKRGV